MKNRPLTKAFPALAAAALAMTAPLGADITATNLLYHWDASDAATATATTWTSKEGSAAGLNDVWAVQANVNQVAATSSSVGITQAYQFGAWLPDSLSGSATRIEFQDAADSGITNESVSYELWIKPDDLAGGRQVIFETGGATRGHHLNLDNDVLTFAVKTSDPGNPDAPAADQQVSHTLVVGDITDFIQVVINLDGVADTIEMFVNPLGEAAPGTSKDNTTWTTGDQPFGTSDSSLGGINGADSGSGEIGGGGTTTAPWQVVDFAGFLGEIAIMRVYDGNLLGTEVTDNFNATFTGPGVVTNNPLTVATNSTGAIISDEAFLLTDDPDTPAASLTYTLTTLPTGGTLLINGVAAVLTTNDTFTQDQVNNDLLTFDAGAVVTVGDSFAFDVSDGACTVSGTFTINVVEPASAVFNLVLTNEDVIATEADLTVGTNLLSNDAGEPITLTEVNGDPANVGVAITTTLGATLTVNVDGTFTYDPTGSPGLQQGGGFDTFTYTIEDLLGGTSTANVTVNVGSVNDLPDATNDIQVGSTFEDANLVSTVDLTLNDGIVRTDGALTDILLLNYDARNGSADRWENLGSNSQGTMDWLLGTGVTRNASVTSTRAQITAAYEWDGTANATADIDPAFGRGIHDIMPGDPDAGPATLEFWVKLGAADLLQNSTIFETGGGTGAGIVVSSGLLEAATGLEAPGQTGSYVSYDLQADPLGLVGGDPTAEFFQIVLGIDAGVGLSLYVNGTLVDSSNAAQADWDGGDNTGIGRFAGANHGGFVNGAATTAYDTFFNGSMAVMRLYSGVLTANQVLQNFVAVNADTDLDGETITVSGILDAGFTSQGIGMPATLASGAIVTLTDATGGFTYNPSGAFESLVSGASAIDTFIYEVSDGAGGLGEADVTVTINGKNDAVDDTIAVRETEVTTFGASAIVGNDEHTLPTPAPFVEYDALNASAGTIPNTGTATGRTATILSGALLSPSEVDSNFGALGAAVRNPVLTFADFDGGISNADATLELWFKPDSGTSGRQLLFETGGAGIGTSIVYDANLNEVVVKIDGDTDTDPSEQLAASIGGVAMDEFNQIVVVFDIDNPTIEDSLTLYLNNDPSAFNGSTVVVTNTAGGVNDWSGSDDSGLGAINGAVGLGESLDPFEGEIALFRVYTRALDASEVEFNYDVENDGIASFVAGSPFITGLGGTVTLNLDGSFTYDTTTLFADVANGVVVQDSFLYTISDGEGGSSQATVTVDITGVDNTFFAVDDNFNIGEDDGPMSFDPLANDTGAGSATIVFPSVVDNAATALGMVGVAAGDPADFTSGGFGWQLLWNAPSDWTGGIGGTSTTAVDGALGDVPNYELLIWSGTAWRPDGDDDTATGDPGGFLSITPAGGHPGLGSGQPGTTPADNALDRAAIVAYTVSSTDFYGIRSSSLGRASTVAGTVSANVYVGSTLIDTVTCNPGQTVDFDMNVGNVTMGDTIYVAIAPDATAGSDTFTLDFDIVTLPAADTPIDDLTGFSTDGSTISFDPAGGFESLALGGSTTRTISYTIVDGANTSTGMFTVTIDGANDASTPNNETNATDEDTVAAGQVLTNDTDPDQGEGGLNLVVSAVDSGSGNVGVPTTTAGGGSITLNADGTYTYSPAPSAQALTIGESVVDTIFYSIEDVNGLPGTADASITITVTGNDDGVIATADDFTSGAGVLSGNLITDDNGNGVDTSIDTSDQLTVLAIDTTGTNGIVTAVAPGVIGVVGQSDLEITDFNDNSFITVNYGVTTFANPVIIAGPPTRNETEPVVVRIRNVNAGAGTFEIGLAEQPNTPLAGGVTDVDGPTTPDLHALETVSWAVIDAGPTGTAQYELPNGALMEVGSLDTTATAGTFETVIFNTTFSGIPAVFHTIQTLNGTTVENIERFGTRARSVGTGGFEVALSEYEGATAARTTLETIGWVAVETGSGDVGGTLFETGLTPNAVTEAAYTVNFAQDYGSAPHFIASMNSYDGVDPSQVRYQNLDNDSAQLLSAEDTINDTELTHADEIMAYFCFSNGGGTIVGSDVSAGVAGDFTYDPNGFSGTDTFTYTLTDGKGNVSVATVTIEVGGGDSDTDGIPDDVEVANGLNPNDDTDALLDKDGDGASNLWDYGMSDNPMAISDPTITPTFLVEVDPGMPSQNRITIGPIFAGRTYFLNEGVAAPLSQVDTFVAGADAATHFFFRPRTLPAILYNAEVQLPLP